MNLLGLIHLVSLLFIAVVGKTVGDDESPRASDYYVWGLPGLDPKETKFHEMHAGHIIVKPEHHGSLFFWHVASQYVIDEPRTIIWLNGGPGCSSFDGALMEVGPYRMKDENTLQDNPGSWNKFADLLFIDQPVGTGLSTIDTDSYVGDLTEIADDILVFLDKYFAIFPEKLSSQLYIAGESYAGQFIPYIAKAILDRNQKIEKEGDPTTRTPPFVFDLRGIVMGNGWIDPVQQYLSYLPFSYSHGILEAGSDWANQIELDHTACVDEMQSMEKATISINSCDNMVQNILKATNERTGSCLNVYDIRLVDRYPSCGMNWPPDLGFIAPYLHKQEVLAALNSYEKSAAGWVECSGQVGEAMRQRVTSPPSVELLPELLESIEVTMFNGDQDFVCNHLGNERLIDKLHWKGATGFGDSVTKTEWNVTGEPVGSVSSARGLNYIVLYNSSHMVPYDQPKAALHMINSILGLNDWAADDDSTNVSPELPKHDLPPSRSKTDKLVSDATWKAYYRAGEIALVVVLIVVSAFGIYLWRNRRQRHQLGSNADAGKSDLFLSFVGGLSRWKPKNRPRGSYTGLHSGSRLSPPSEAEELYHASPHMESGSELEELVAPEPEEEV